MPECPFEIIEFGSSAKEAFAKIKNKNSIGKKDSFIEFIKPKGVREKTVIKAVQDSLIFHDLKMNELLDPPALKQEVKQMKSYASDSNGN